MASGIAYPGVSRVAAIPPSDFTESLINTWNLTARFLCDRVFRDRMIAKWEALGSGRNELLRDVAKSLRGENTPYSSPCERAVNDDAWNGRALTSM
jgi:hypothetical protein